MDDASLPPMGFFFLQRTHPANLEITQARLSPTQIWANESMPAGTDLCTTPTGNNPGMHHFEIMRPVLAGMF